MSRPIKFRAWDRAARLMISDVAHRQRGGLIVMQFTGLLDKNGVEIYEGDIVKMHYFDEGISNGGAYERDNEIVGKIAYRPDYATYVVDGVDDRDYTISEYCQEPSEELEVIGNIHESPNLLNESRDE